MGVSLMYEPYRTPIEERLSPSEPFLGRSVGEKSFPGTPAGWNDTAADYPRTRGVHELFAAQAARTPDRVAVVCGRAQVTYAELNRRANQLAHHLRAHGVGPNVLVGVCLERSVDMLVALLGILKSGGAYLPLDPAFPQARLTFMVDDARTALLITQEPLRQVLLSRAVATVCLDADAAAIALHDDADVRDFGAADRAAYVLYTSGSTGQPKGVQVPHRALVNLLVSMRRLLEVRENDVLLAVTTLSFDIAALELFLPLIVGARVVVADHDAVRDGERLAETLSACEATMLQATPATWRLLLQAGWAGQPELKMLCGGEALPADLARQLLPRGGELWNLYGPTETTIWSTAYRVRGDEETIPIGRPLANTQVHILDVEGCPLPVGVAGELYIGGDGVALGYLGRPDLTAERFVADAFSSVPAARLYKTGDLAQWREDGQLEYLGRLDQQVKVRGFRIEPGEVEMALRRHRSIREAVVVALDDDGTGEKRLVAYVVPARGATVSGADVRAFLRGQLPEYMNPAAYVTLHDLPLTPNGKIDRRALPAPSEAAELRGADISPRNPLEFQLAAMWEDVLGVRAVGVTDSFFDLGGTSLLAAKLFAEIERRFGKRLPIATLLQAPTVEQLAHILRQEEWCAPWSSLVAIQTGGSKPPLFCVHGVGGNVLEFRDVGRHLGTDQPVYGLQAQGLDGTQEPYSRVEAMAAHYVREIRAVQLEGPYALGGYSFGGMVAFEMAQQLVAEGQSVSLVALLDTDCPDYVTPPLLRRLTSHVAQFLGSGLRFSDRVAYLRTRIQRAFSKMVYRSLRSLNRPLPPALRNVEMINRQAMQIYVPRPYAGRVTLFRAADTAAEVGSDAESGWRRLASGGLDVQPVPGNHDTFVMEPRVRILSERLSACLERGRSVPDA
ncbi:MAG: hypothetical protein QOD06_2102 [Candidatus Binatota bacterium]|jgi:amino acid adenylation domain-containing protein|nr:hypothetical protein [Candidatus Binatota bacterium]